MRSKEYLEYYCDDEFKAASCVTSRGPPPTPKTSLLKRLKATAVRVEVRHFDGYTAIAEVIKNPQRTGMALVARELALAKTGKGILFWQLMRAVRLAAVILTPDGRSVAATHSERKSTPGRGGRSSSVSPKPRCGLSPA